MIVDVKVSIIVADVDTGDIQDDDWLLEQLDDLCNALDTYVSDYGFKVNEVTYDQRS